MRDRHAYDDPDLVEGWEDAWERPPRRAASSLEMEGRYLGRAQIWRLFLALLILAAAAAAAYLAVSYPARVALVMVGSLIGSTVVFFYPFTGLLGQVALYFYPVQVWGGPTFLRPVFILTFATLLFFVLHRVNRHQVRVSFPPILRALGIMLAAMTASSFFAVLDTRASYDKNIVFLKLLVFVFLMIHLLDTVKRLRIFLVCLMVGAGYSAAQAIRQGLYYGAVRVDEVGGSQGEANALAAMLLMTLPFLVHWGFSGRNLTVRLVALGCIPAWLLGFAYTGSRGGVLGLAMVLVLLVLRARKKGQAVALVISVAVVFSLMAPSLFWERASSIGEYEEDSSAQARIEMWKVGWRMWMDHPLTGVGQDNFHLISTQYTEYRSQDGGGLVAHNVYVQFLAEGGWQVLLAFGLAVILALRHLSIVAKPRSTPGTEEIQGLASATQVGLGGFLVCGVFLSAGHFDILYWFLGLAQVLKLQSDRALAAEPAAPPESAAPPEPARVQRPSAAQPSAARAFHAPGDAPA